MKRPFLALATLLVSASLASAQSGGVRGKIFDDKGAPLDAVAVVMEFQGGVTLKFESKTNKKGEFMQIGMRPGNWKFTYTREGFQVFASPYRVALGDATALPDVKLVLAKAAAATLSGAEDIQKSFGAAVALLQAADYDGAIAAFDAMILKNPSLAEAHYNKAFALYQKKDYPAAEASLQRALEVKADYSDARVLLSNIYTAQGLKDKAVEVMSAGAGSTDPRQLFNLGLALLNSGKNAEAAEAFAKVEKADPTHVEVQYYLGTAALNAGKADECVARLEKYLSMDPKSEQNKATALGLIAALKKK